MKQIMENIQKYDILLAGIIVEETYDFAIDMNTYLNELSKYQLEYYKKCEDDGLTYEEALEQLGNYLSTHLQENVEKVDTL